MPLVLVLLLSLNILNPFLLANRLPKNEISYPERINQESLGLDISAASALVVDASGGKVLFSKNKEEIRSIASITKLMSVLVILDEGVDFEKEIAIKESDRRQGGRIYLGKGEVASVLDLINLVLIASDNSSAISLVRGAGFQEEEFVALMNKKAGELGMENTSFSDPTGLDAGNVSTAEDLTKLAKVIFAREEIAEIATRQEYFFKERRNNLPHRVFSTDSLLNSFLDGNGEFTLMAGKTGYLPEAGYCFLSQSKNEAGNKIITVILGSESPSGRFQETKGLVVWTFNNWVW